MASWDPGSCNDCGCTKGLTHEPRGRAGTTSTCPSTGPSLLHTDPHRFPSGTTDGGTARRSDMTVCRGEVKALSLCGVTGCC